MAEPMTGPITRCTWCSAALPETAVEQCPTCGAILVAPPDVPGEIKGVTTLDTEAILRARSEVNRPRSNRLLSFITGEVPPEAPSEASPDSLARPAAAVRREMLRLQLEAEAADLQAEAVALKADELARRGIRLGDLGDAAAPPGASAEPGDAPEPGDSPDAASATDAGGATEGTWPEELTPDTEPGPKG